MTPPPTGNLHAILAMLASVGCFAVLDTALKQLSGTYSPAQVTFVRAVASLPFVLAPVAWSGAWDDLRPRRWSLHLVRGVLGVLMLWSFVYALSQLSLANTYSIYMFAPLLVVALSVPLLGERVPARRWVAIVVGLSGVLLVLRPAGEGLTAVGALLAAGSALCYALSTLLIRVLGRTESSRSMVFWYLAMIAIGASFWALPDWRPLLREHYPWIVLIGLAGAGGQYLLTEAFRRAPPSVVVPFEYTAILWAIGFDWLFWRILPGAWIVAGAGIVIACGLYVGWDERRSAYARASPPP